MFRQLRLVRAAGGPAFLTVPVDLAGPVPGSASDSYPLSAGSAWIASALFDPAAPANGYCGLRIRAGRLRFTQPIAIAGDELVVPAALACTLDLEFDVTPTAQCSPPPTATLTIDATRASVTLLGRGHVQALGSAADLTQAPASNTYLPELQCIAVRMSSNAPTFEVRTVGWKSFRPDGRATIAWGAWGLPIDVADPAQLGEARGAGELLLGLDTGLTATWIRQPRAVALGPGVLAIDPAHIALVASTARAHGVQQRFALWHTGAPSYALVRYGQSFALTFSAQTVDAVETLAIDASLEASIDRPVDVKGDRLALGSRTARVTFVAGATGISVDLTANLDVPSGVDRIGLALKNGVFVTSPPETLSLHAELDPAGGGTCVLSFLQRALVPALPDPYAANLDALRVVLDQPTVQLVSTITWTDPKSAKLDFVVKNGGPIPSRAAGDWPEDDATGNAFDFEREKKLILVDVSTHTDQFGVAVAGTAPNVEVNDLTLERSDVALMTLPAVQWEAVISEPDPKDPTFPRRLGFANSGVPYVIDVPPVRLVPVDPKGAIDALLDHFARSDPRPARARFTLPFGMIASADLLAPIPDRPSGTALSLVRPKTAELEGGHQLSIRAVDPSLPPGTTPGLPGHTAQLSVGLPGSRSVLGELTTTFNTYLGANGKLPLVPVTRIDVSGYGESLFSDWRNPTTDAVAVGQARFDVVIGRTAHEVVQFRSLLCAYAVEVVRTITIERRDNAIVHRKDSGWQAVSDGVYKFPEMPIETHPGVVKRITRVTNIRPTGEIQTIDGFKLSAVRFDGDLELEGAPALVPARNQLGYVLLTANEHFTPAIYAKLIAAAGPLCGGVDAEIAIGGGGQRMRVQRVGVGVTQGAAGPEFVMSASGSPLFPRGGDWSFLRVTDPNQPPTAIDKDGVPLIRAGLASAGAPQPGSPYRFSDAADLAQPDSPATDYGILHATGTQRAFFPRPRIEATDTNRIASTITASLADPFSLATSRSAFPELNKAIPMPAGGWAFAIGAGGTYRLEEPKSPFPVSVGRRTLQQAGSVKGDVDFTGAEVTYEVDTAQPVAWKFELVGARQVMNESSMGDLITVPTNVRASDDQATTFTEPRVRLGGALGIVQDLLTILEDLGIVGTLTTAMDGEFGFKAWLKVPFKDAVGSMATGEDIDLQIPPWPAPEPTVKFSDTGLELVLAFNDKKFEAEFTAGGMPIIEIKKIPFAALIEFVFKLSTETGTSYSLMLGGGISWEKKYGKLKLLGRALITFFGVTGGKYEEKFFGYGAGLLLKGVVELPAVEISVTIEAKAARVIACENQPNESVYMVYIGSLEVEIAIGPIFGVGFEIEFSEDQQCKGDGTCPLPDVVP